MTHALNLRDRLDELDAAHSDYAVQFVNALLAGASDVHRLPDREGLLVRWRIDGVLQPVGRFSAGRQSDVVSRLKVIAGLLTYRSELPQEGRIRKPESDAEMRVTTFHAGSAVEAVSRLLEMGIEPYVLRSGILAVYNQRLLRRLCDCSQQVQDADLLLGLPVESARRENGCEACMGTGFRGRILVAEMFVAGARTSVVRSCHVPNRPNSRCWRSSPV